MYISKILFPTDYHVTEVIDTLSIINNRYIQSMRTLFMVAIIERDSSICSGIYVPNYRCMNEFVQD